MAQSLTTLGMPAAQFEVELHRPGAIRRGCPRRPDRWRRQPRGLDEVRFLFCANQGEELRPLAKVASGGELSRIMLAFKSLCSRGS